MTNIVNVIKYICLVTLPNRNPNNLAFSINGEKLTFNVIDTFEPYSIFGIESFYQDDFNTICRVTYNDKNAFNKTYNRANCSSNNPAITYNISSNDQNKPKSAKNAVIDLKSIKKNVIFSKKDGDGENIVEIMICRQDNSPTNYELSAIKKIDHSYMPKSDTYFSSARKLITWAVYMPFDAITNLGRKLKCVLGDSAEGILPYVIGESEKNKQTIRMISLLVYLTRDESLVVHIGDSVEARLICDMTLHEFLASVDSIKKKNPKNPAAPLAVMLNDLPNDLAVNIVIMSPTDGILRPEPADYMKNVVAELMKMARERKLLYSSFSPWACALLKMIDSGNKVVLLVPGDFYNVSWCQYSTVMRAIAEFSTTIKLNGIAFDGAFYNSNISRIKEHISDVISYIVCYGEGADDEVTAKKLLSNGVSALMVDRIETIKELAH